LNTVTEELKNPKRYINGKRNGVQLSDYSTCLIEIYGWPL
jgi:hypothetical protein